MRSVGANDVKRSSPALLAVLVALALVLTTLYYREGSEGPLRTFRAGVLAATAPAVRVGHWVTGPLRWSRDRSSGLLVSRAEVEELRRQNGLLRERNAELEEAWLENERLRALVGFVQREDYDALAARIIGRPANSWEGAIVIDRGSDQGIAKGMPVVAGGVWDDRQGLLGQVVEVTAGSARVRLITDQRSGVAAIVSRTRGGGIVRGSIEGGLSLDFLDRRHVPKPGDVILTSGMGGTYPKGLHIGEVVEVDERPSDLFPHILVTPAVSTHEVEEVLVLRSGSPILEGDPE